ncbi:protein of unknown function DUF305 [Ktedonobacter racemifer DSM 44963]|uniref:DUF305 domain-containing protein n=1 Tax=Ktedonobacter racemifer DSM 44963 TaxID=485913 RepID=D6TCT4_KTERA|nr:protein of unknown function DUF305 [Ktedonobacter racemifer DSM 44963]
MGRRRSIYVLGTRGQRRAEARLRASEQRDEPSRATTMDRLRGSVPLFHCMLFGLGVLLLAAALIIGITLSNTTPSSNAEEMSFFAKNNAAMAKMMVGMKIKPSGDVDRDFVAMMVPHHQGAIDMAKAELSYGHNEKLRAIAQEIIVTQQEDIATMRLALVDIPTSSSQFTSQDEGPFFAKNNVAMAKMMVGMKIKPSGDVDRDFVAMMVPHHQGAIDMAKAELMYGHDEPLRGLAQEIIATQQQEIVAMQLDERG